MAHTVAVIGGGIAGLTTAFELMDRADVVCLEAAPRAGGHIRTERIDGFTCEWGANGFLDSAPATLDLVARLHLEPSLQPADAAAARRFVYRRGRLHEAPLGPGTLVRSGLLTWGEKLRLAAEVLQPRRRTDGDESVLDFAARRIGRGAASILVDAMVGGVYAGDARKLSLAATFPKMAAMERAHGSLTRAMVASRKGAVPRGHLTSFKGGMQEIIDALTEALGPRLRTSTAVRALERSGGGYSLHLADGSTLEAERVAVTIPSGNAASVLQDLDRDLATPLREIEAAPVVVCHLGFQERDVAHMPRGFGFLVPRSEGLRLLGVLWASTIFPQRAPAGKVLYTCMLGGATERQCMHWPDEKVMATVLDELHTTMHLHAEPIFSRIYRHHAGIPQYTLGHPERLALVDAALVRNPGLHLGGSSYHGVSANDCIRNAGTTVDRMLAD